MHCAPQGPLLPTRVRAPQPVLQPREEPVDVRAARERGELDRRKGRRRVLRRLDEELAVAPVAPRRGSVLDERPHDLQVAGEHRDVERFQADAVDALGQHRQQVLAQVVHPRLGREPELVVRSEGQLGLLQFGPTRPGLARRAVEDVRLAARLVLLRLRLRARAQEDARRRRAVERRQGDRLVAAGGHALRVGSRSRRWFRRVVVHRCRRRLGDCSRGD
mmetsp:Transcript_2867/g.6860  ORF Transcript_2867/g.6860 Transcript_2867/m.6860 type:complete len:219 (-) Transcript_2867:259-915(-)